MGIVLLLGCILFWGIIIQLVTNWTWLSNVIKIILVIMMAFVCISIVAYIHKRNKEKLDKAQFKMPNVFNKRTKTEEE